MKQNKGEEAMSFCGQCGTPIEAVSFCPSCGAQAGDSTAVLTTSADAPRAEPGVFSAYAIAAFALSMCSLLTIGFTLWRMSDVVNWLLFIVQMMIVSIGTSALAVFVGGIAVIRIKERNQRGRFLAATAVGIGWTIAILFVLALVLGPLIAIGVVTWPSGGAA